MKILNANGRQTTFKSVPAPLAVMGKNISGIASIVRIHEEFNQPLTDQQEQKIFDQNKIAYVDSTFLKVFDFKVLKGSDLQMLPAAENIALTKQTALKLFGTTYVLGMPVRFNQKTFTVSAVLDNFPGNSTIQYDALLPMAYFSARFTSEGGNKAYKTMDQDIGSYMYSTYVLCYRSGPPLGVILASGFIDSPKWRCLNPFLFCVRLRNTTRQYS